MRVRALMEIDATQSPVEHMNRQVRYGCKRYNFCITVPRGTLKSSTRNLKLLTAARGRAVHPQLAGLAGNEAFIASLASKMMVKLGCSRSLCVVDGLLNNMMSSDDLELCNFAAPLYSEPHCVLDTPLYLSLKAH